MDVRSLPQSPRPMVPVAIFHVLHGAVVASVSSALLLNGLYLLQQPEGTRAGRWLVFLVICLMFAEAALGAWLILRRRRIQRRVKRARAALLEGDALEAELALTGLLEHWEFRLNPAPVCYGLGLVALLRDDLSASLQFLRRAGNHRASLELRVVLLLESGMVAQASRLASVLFRRWPNLARTWILQAAVLQRRGQNEEAMRMVETAIRKRPRAVLLKRCHELLKKNEDVLELLDGAKPRLPD